MSHVIFLHGASSSGKSTIARALQARIELPFWHVSIDHLRDGGVLPMARFKSGEFDWAATRPAFFQGFHASLKAYADAGNHLILEHILEYPDWAGLLRDILMGHDVFFVGVHCPLPLLEARELARGDRPIGSAREDFARVHQGLTYDLEVNAEDGPEHNADLILQGWRSGKRGSSLAGPQA